MSDPDRTKLSISKGIYFSKIGDKITKTSQPLDLGPFLKILKKICRTITSMGVHSPLSMLVESIFVSLCKKKARILSTLKENALKDCIRTYPYVIAASFLKHILIQSLNLLG